MPALSTHAYRRVLLNPATRSLLLLGFLIRVPMFGVSVILTIHVVQTLHRSWSQAGLVAAAATLAVAISGPWRGKLLDRIGLRRVVAPSIVVTIVCWSIAPFVGYLPLLVLASLAGLFAVPTFTIIRQGLIAAVTEDDRRTALSVDGITVEMAFMLGPVIAIALISVYPTQWVIFGLEMLCAAMAALLCLVNPSMRRAIEEEEAVAERIPRRSWLTPRFLAVCMVAFAAVLVLSGSDVSFVAAAKHFDASGQLGIVLAATAIGSAIGGVVYGALAKPPGLFLLLVALAALTGLIGAAQSMLTLGVLGFVAGLFITPTMTASVDAVARVVPEKVRGEAMGWHGSFLTLGGALGGPIAGVFIDHYDFVGGFVSVGALGLALAIGGWVLIWVRRRAMAYRHGQPRHQV